MSLAEMKPSLDASSGSDWVEGDSSYHGDYLAKQLAEHTVARIYKLARGFIVELRYRDLGDDHELAEQRMAQATAVLQERILPAISASDIATAAPLD